MNQDDQCIRPAPVRKSLFIACEPAHAFQVFARQMGRWWPKNHSISASPLTEVVIEPFAGGRWYQRNADGGECDWGSVIAFDPPHRLVLGWSLNGDWSYDPDLVTEVEATFTAEGEGTRFEFEHRNLERFGDKAQAVRDAIDSPGGWGSILRDFAAAAAAAAEAVDGGAGPETVHRQA